MSMSMSKHAALCTQVIYRSEYNFLRLSGKNEVTSDKENFRPGMRQKLFLKLVRHQEFVWLLKRFGVALPSQILNLGKHYIYQHPIELQ